MKILITGSNGFIAQHLICTLLSSNKHTIISTARSNLYYDAIKNFKFHSLDIVNEEETKNVFSFYKPDVVIHLAALSLPNYCELNKEECLKVNVAGTKNVIDACKPINAYLLFASTDFVFNGKDGPYKEEDKTDPVNFYGFSKVNAEKLCMESELNYSIIRLCSVYGKSLDNKNRGVVNWVKENLGERKPLKAFDDQVRTPTYIDDVIDAIIILAEKKLYGVYHLAGPDTLTPYGMAVKTAKYLSLDENLIEKVTAETFKEVAVRPAVTGLMIDKAKRDFGFNPKSFEEGLKKMFTV